ncbi:MAG: LON peptidase substrate-binding domain-containing protein [Gammaproteobacteria bacterium]
MDTNSHDELPLFPLGTVLFPGNTVPLRIFEPRYVDLIGRCMRDSSGFGVVGIREGREAGGTALPHATGTIAHIIDFDRGADGLLNIVIRGASRFRIATTRRHDDKLLVADITPLPDIDDVPVPDDFHSLGELFDEILAKLHIDGDERTVPTSSAALAYALAQYLPLSVTTKVGLLEINDPIELLIRLSNDVRRLRQGARGN